MSLSNLQKQIAQKILRDADRFYDNGWLMGTSGNLSARTNADKIIITKTGKHKGELSGEDFVEISLESENRSELEKVSSDFAIHRTIYRRFDEAKALYHVHEPHAVALSQRASEFIAFSGYSIQKAFGLSDPQDRSRLPVLEDDGSPESLAKRFETRFDSVDSEYLPAFIAEKHGIYAWGDSPFSARRHIEAVAHLLECRVIEQNMENPNGI